MYIFVRVAVPSCRLLFQIKSLRCDDGMALRKQLNKSGYKKYKRMVKIFFYFLLVLLIENVSHVRGDVEEDVSSLRILG